MEYTSTVERARDYPNTPPCSDIPREFRFRTLDLDGPL